MPTPSYTGSSRNRRRFIALAIAVAVIIGTVYACSGGKQGDGQGGHGGPGGMAGGPPPEVTALDVQPQDMPLVYEYAGRTAGSREVEIRARVSGILEKRLYTEGASVKKGDILFRIDSAPFAAAQAQIRARYTQAERDWQRVQQLHAEKAVSEREYDEARAAFEASRAELTTAGINLGYTTVVAPISGVTSQEGLSEGSLVAADTSLLTRISQLDPIYVNFSEPDAEFLAQRRAVAEGALALPDSGRLTAEIRFGDGSVYAQTGTVDFIDTSIDEQTGSVRARAVVPNEKGAILPGQFVRVVITGAVVKNAVAIPDKAVMQGPMGPFVYVVNEESKATIRPVQLGLLNGEKRIISSGLKAGDKVIVEGMIKARPDAPVTIAQPKAAEAQSAGGQSAGGQPQGEPAGGKKE